MKKKKILVLTMSQSQSSYEVGRLVEEAKKVEIEVNKALYKNLIFDLSNGRERVLVKGEEITADNTLAVWFRVAGTKSGKYVEGRNLMIRLLEDKVFCTNHQSYLGWPRMGKIAQHGVFLENGILVVPTRIFYTREQVWQSRMEEEWGWPIICKHDRGYQGKGVRKFELEEEMIKWLERVEEKNIGMYLWQKFLPTRWDIRVIVIDKKAIGAMKRSAVGKEFRSNYSLGGAVEKWELSESDKNLAEKVAKVAGLDYGGVDIMKSRRNPSKSPPPEADWRFDKGDFDEAEWDSYVLEVNRQCQFQGFEKSTGISVAGKVIEMVLRYT